MNGQGMAEIDAGIVERYAEHLSGRAESVVLSFAVGGSVAGAVLGSVPGFLSHSLIAPGANYFAVLLVAIAGGFVGRSIGEKRAVGLRLQAQMTLRQLQVEQRLIRPAAVAPATPAPIPAALAPVPPVAPVVAAAPPLLVQPAAPAAPPAVPPPAPLTVAPPPPPLPPVVAVEPPPAPVLVPPAQPPLSSRG